MRSWIAIATAVLSTLSLLSNVVWSLNNGLALTPPMGWLSWERFRCNTDCVNYPTECISQQLYMDMADQMVQQGFLQAGYEYVNVDDCWAEMERDANGQMVADKTRFPDGIQGLANYVHSKGLKLGLYTDIGTNTCGGYPGSEGYFDIDAKTFAGWGIDSLKVDGCYANASSYGEMYPMFGDALNDTGRPIVYYCSWPAYIIGSANFTLISQYCNGWRAFDDIQDSADSLYSIMAWWGANQDQLAAAAGPGAWNDADMLIIGDFGLSYSLAQIQMAVWAIIASPLMMSNDLRSISQEMAELLKNADIIAVNQDPAGKQGSMVNSISTPVLQWWTRSLAGGDLAVVALSSSPSLGSFTQVSTSLASLGWNSPQASVRDLFKQVDVGTVTNNLTLTVAPNSCAMVRLSLP